MIRVSGPLFAKPDLLPFEASRTTSEYHWTWGSVRWAFVDKFISAFRRRFQSSNQCIWLIFWAIIQLFVNLCAVRICYSVAIFLFLRLYKSLKSLLYVAAETCSIHWDIWIILGTDSCLERSQILVGTFAQVTLHRDISVKVSLSLDFDDPRVGFLNLD